MVYALVTLGKKNCCQVICEKFAVPTGQISFVCENSKSAPNSDIFPKLRLVSKLSNCLIFEKIQMEPTFKQSLIFEKWEGVKF